MDELQQILYLSSFWITEHTWRYWNVEDASNPPALDIVDYAGKDACKGRIDTIEAALVGYDQPRNLTNEFVGFFHHSISCIRGHFGFGHGLETPDLTIIYLAH